MTAHIACPELDPSGDPATLSAPDPPGLLRDELGYDGLVITDSLQMAGVRARYDDAEIAVRALEAGVDLLLMPADPDAAPRAVLEAVRTGRLSADRFATSVRRVLGMKFDRGLARPPATSPDARGQAIDQIGWIEHRQIADDAAVAAVTLLRDDDGLLPIGGGRCWCSASTRGPEPRWPPSSLRPGSTPGPPSVRPRPTGRRSPRCSHRPRRSRRWCYWWPTWLGVRA